MPAHQKVEDSDIQCKDCEGTGMAVPDCETCNGTGWVDDEADGGTMTCPDCTGDVCDQCHGTGESGSDDDGGRVKPLGPDDAEFGMKP